MSTNALTKKLTQITEESLAPLEVPLIIGSDCYVVTQQDTRRIEDIRFLNFSKLCPNGVLKPIDAAAAEELLVQAIKAANANTACRNVCEQEKQKFQTFVCPQPMETSTNPATSSYTSVKASVQQQLAWDKCTNTSVPYPFSYSCATSTTDLCFFTTAQNIQPHSHYACNPCEVTNKTVRFSKGTHTNQQENNPPQCLDAREQLKKRKMLNSSL